MSKKIIILIIIFICISFGFAIINNKIKQKNKTENKIENKIQPSDNLIDRITVSQLDYEKIELDYEKLNLVPKKSELYFNHINDGVLYLSVLDEKNNVAKPLMTTPKLITYNLKTKEYKIYNYDYDIRIWDYIIRDNTIYFTTIEETNDGKIEWNLIYSDLNFDNAKILKHGTISDGLFSPNIILDDENIYVVTLDENNYNAKYNFYKINTDNSVEELLTIDNSVESISYLYRIVIEDDNIYYMAYNKTKQFLYKYNYKSKEKNIIFSIENDDSAIFDFIVMNDYYVIDLVNKNDKSSLVIKYNDGKVLNVDDLTFLSSFRKVNENRFLTHNNVKTNNGGRVFKLFDRDGNVEKEFTFENLFLNYKYMVYDSNYIIVSNYEPNELYIYDLRKLK